MEERKTNHNHQGELNPFYGKTHTEESKQAISAKQRFNYERIQEVLDKLSALEQEQLAELISQKVLDKFNEKGVIICKQVITEDIYDEIPR